MLLRDAVTWNYATGASRWRARTRSWQLRRGRPGRGRWHRRGPPRARSRWSGAKKASVRALSTRGAPSRSAALTASLHGRCCLGQGTHLVFEVRAGHPGSDGPGDSGGRVAISGLQVGADRQIGRRDDPGGHVEHQGGGDVLSVGATDGDGDRCTRGGEGLAAGLGGGGTGGGHVPDVDQHQIARRQCAGVAARRPCQWRSSQQPPTERIGVARQPKTGARIREPLQLEEAIGAGGGYE